MKKFLLSLLFLVIIMNLYSQVKFEIAELNVSNINPNLCDSVYIEGEKDGPNVYMKCVFSNESNSDILIHPSKSEIYVLFNYREVNYRVEVVAMPFADNESLIIRSKEKIEFNLWTLIFLGTQLWNENETNYTMILLEVLPTIRVHYRDTKSNLFSSKIERVNIRNF